MNKIQVFAVLAISLFLLSSCSQAPGVPTQEMEHDEDPMAPAQPDPSGTIETGSDTIGWTDTETPEPSEADTATASSAGVKEFKVEANNFKFTPSAIEVNKGDKVRLLVTSKDVTHGIAIPEYGINERLPVGEEVVIEFTADNSGSFNTFCSVACGHGHRDMKGMIVVK
jgi:plastocyanin